MNNRLYKRVYVTDWYVSVVETREDMTPSDKNKGNSAMKIVNIVMTS